jgi:hypothetical protein
MTAPVIAPTRSTRWLATLALVVAGSVSALLLWSRRDYVPMFDGRFYADCIGRVVAHPGYIAEYRCGHIDEAFVAILAFGARLVPEMSKALLVENTLLLLLAVAALWRVVRSAFPDEQHRVGRALIVGALLIHPIVLAAVVQPGLDLGLLVFSLCALAAALEGRRWTLALFGVLLIFSKEPGVLLYGAIVAVWMWRRVEPMLSPGDAVRVGIAALLILGLLALMGHETPSALFFLAAAGLAALRPRPPRRSALPSFEGLARTVLHEWPLIVPVVLLLGYLLYYRLRPSALDDGTAVMWGGGGSAIGMLFRGGLFDLSTRISLLLMFVIGFLWVPSMWMLVDLAIGTVRHVRDQPARPLPGIDRSALAFIIVVLLADVWLLSRYVTYSNTRYYLPVLPLALIAAYAALVRLRVPAFGREALLGAVTLLLAVSTVRTLDPVSRKIWGTFRFGDRSILSINSLTEECCGRARDQMAYNLEFTELSLLLDMLFARLEPSDSTVLVLERDADWHTVGALDRVTHRRTLRSTGVVRPKELTVGDTDTLKAARAWYIEMPFTDDTAAIALITRRFDLGERCTVSHGPYRLSAREMRLRPTAAATRSTTTLPASGSAGSSPCASRPTTVSVR